MANLPNLLAGNESLGAWAPVQVFSGDADLHSDGATCAVDFPIYSVLAFTPAGLLTPHVPGATDSTGTAFAVAAQAGRTGQKCPYYTSGQFNPEALVWDASLTTVAQRKAVFVNSPVMIKEIF